MNIETFTIDDLIQDLHNFNGLRNGVFHGLHRDDERVIRENDEIIRHVETENFERIFEVMLSLLEPLENRVGRKYINHYSHQPNNHCRRHLVLSHF